MKNFGYTTHRRTYIFKLDSWPVQTPLLRIVSFRCAVRNRHAPACLIMFLHAQDDDYLVKPEIIRSLRARIDTHDIFLLPPDEALSSNLLSINSPSTNITFAFAWLGYGALILKSHAESFLSLLERLGVSREEAKMADNYYSILRNSFPEIWTGAPIALFGGGDFTVGEEGVVRNRKHIVSSAVFFCQNVSHTARLQLLSILTQLYLLL